MPLTRKSKHKDCYETLAENVRLMTMNNNDAERQVMKSLFSIGC